MAFNNPKQYFAPAKINLSLNVTGKRSDSYHLLHSLTVFANFGDEITIKPADKFLFTQESELKNLPEDNNNLVIKTAARLADKLGQNLNCHLHLKKNIPIGAGLGGGSSDAAATVKALLEFWDIDFQGVALDEFLLSLGADIPVCYQARTCIFEGVGETITPAPALPPLYAVLVYPNQFCSTVDVFKNYQGQYSTPPARQENIWNYLEKLQNDLTDAAIENIPEIKDVLESLNTQKNIIFARMSGSGSCCFGIFETQAQSENAAKYIQTKNPKWWVKPVILN